jgi:hypothetical protein
MRLLLETGPVKSAKVENRCRELPGMNPPMPLHLPQFAPGHAFARAWRLRSVSQPCYVLQYEG